MKRGSFPDKNVLLDTLKQCALGRYAAQKDHFLRIDLEDFHVSTNAYFPPNGQLTDLMYIPLQFIHFLWMRFTLYANEVERDWFLLGAKKS